MAGSFTNELEYDILNFVFKAVALTFTGNRTLALYKVDPGENVTNGTAGEPSGGAYARATITFATAVTGTPTTIKNSTAITFAQATADWLSGSDIDGWAVFDSTATPQALMHGDFLVAKPVLSGDTAKVLKDNLTLTLE